MRIKSVYLSLAIVAVVMVAIVNPAQSQMKKPDIVTVSGKLIDLSCSAKGQKMMGSDHNALNNDHMTPDGEKKACATMCLKSGQPAGVFKDGKVVATLLASASLNLYKFAAEDVEVQGWWAGKKQNDVKTFFPTKIRKKGSREWTEVMTAQMHDQ